MSLLKANNPTFSIIIPCYNQGVFLEDCINSVLAQKFDNWEAIIINDGSFDDTEAIARSYEALNARIIVQSQTNQGLSSARNNGMAVAKGDYLLFLDADDWIETNAFSTLSTVIFEHPGYELYRMGYSYWDKPKGLYFHTHVPMANGEIFHQVLTQNIGPCHSIIVRKDLAKMLGGFDPLLRSCEDWDFWIRAGKMGAKIQSIPEVLVGYRYVPTSMSRNPRVMYDSLSEVSRRAGKKDYRLPKEAPFNQDYELDYPTLQKKHLIRMLGVMLHQRKVSEAVEWYSTEKKVWKWKETDMDWKGLSSYLSWGYFFEQNQIDHLLVETARDLDEFFTLLGFSPKKIQILIQMIFEPQFKKRNHYRFGRVLGALKNRLDWY